MKSVFSIIWFFVLLVNALAQTLTAVPTHPSPGIQLTWSGLTGTKTIYRWVDGGIPTSIGTTAGTTITDSTAVANTIYYYYVTDGILTTNTVNGAVSDITLPFNCPLIPQAANLGVDRTETFTSADGSVVSFTIKVPVTTATFTVAPCNGAGGCSDYNNINAHAMTNGAKIQLQAGNYHLSNPSWASGGFIYNIWINGDDIELVGAGLDTNGIPLTHLFFNIDPSHTPNGFIVSGHRSLFKNFTIDWDFPNALPGVVNNVVDATFTGSMVSGNTTLTVSGISGSIVLPPAGNSFIYDSSAGVKLTAKVQILSQLTGTPGSNGTYGTDFTPAGNISAETMTSVSTQRFNVGDPHNAGANGAYYVPDPMNPPVLSGGLSAYNLAAKSYNMLSGSRVGINTTGFNPSYPTGGYFYNLAGGANLPDGTEAIMFTTTGIGISVGAAAIDANFENVMIVGGGAAGLIQGSQSKGLRLSNFAIVRKPDSILAIGEQPRYVALRGDSDANFSYGNIIIENSEMGHIDDDSFYMRGDVFQPTSDSMPAPLTTSSFTINTGFGYPLATDQIKFIDPISYAQIGPISTATITNIGGGKASFAFTAVPELAPYVGLVPSKQPIIGLLGTSVPNFIIRDSCFHDNHGRIFPKNMNGLIEDNVFGNSYYGPIEMSMDPTAPNFALLEGPGPLNIIARRNKFVGTNYGNTDRQLLWNPLNVSNLGLSSGWATAAIFMYGIDGDGFSPTGYPYKWIQVYDNWLTNTAGLCITIIGGNNIGVVNNTCVDANAVAFQANYDATYCGTNSMGTSGQQPFCLAKVAASGAVMVAWSKNVDATSQANVFLGTSGSLFVNTPTVSKNNILGLIH